MSNITKLYAAYKAGYLGNNILDTYFSFMANMITEEHLTVVEDTVIATKFNDRKLQYQVEHFICLNQSGTSKMRPG